VSFWSRRQFLAMALKPGYELLRLDLQTDRVDASLWSSSLVLPGSLVKPFTAVAYGSKFPKVVCKGCRPGSVHGEIELLDAIAQSCNRYFEELSVRVRHEQACLVAANYGLAAPPDSVDARVGLGREWRVEPASLIRAYARLLANREDATVKLILEGMKRCAARGTANVLRGRAFAKTGTSACEHVNRMPGDGLAIAMWPLESPRSVVLVREHGVPGAVAAKRLVGLVS
jgi:cell division protein FtsI/penicillin-binding protein 2